MTTIFRTVLFCLGTLIALSGCDVPGRVGIPVPVNTVVDSNSAKFYLFTYFINAEESRGARLAVSSDGVNFHRYVDGQPIMTPLVGVGKLMRDPTIHYDARARKFHMVWTCGWNETGIGYSSSTDLKNWTPQQFLPVGRDIPECACCWAPELFYDEASDSMMIFWSTEVGQNGKRLYYVMTRDFQTFSDPVKFFDPGYTVIDGQIIKAAPDKFIMFFKDERTALQAKRKAKNIHYVTAPSPRGPYPTSDAGVSPGITDVGYEGPCAILMGEEVWLYADPFADFADISRLFKLKLAEVESTTAFWPPGPTLMTASGPFLWNHASIIEIPRKYALHLVFNKPL
ncbi:MAG: glycoside hydrolase family 43 protein [Chitinispirillaceae bacterium]|nr:glycoside hydrolase family 43 protein [Chitinispirillaceae bacterium]